MEAELIQVLSTLITVAGFLAVLFSLYLSRRQTKEMIAQSRSIADSLKYSTFENVVSETTQFNQQFIGHPEVRPYFFHGMDISESDHNYYLVASFADYALDYFDFLLIQSWQFPQAFPGIIWRAFIRDIFGTSPFLRRYLGSELVERWYTPELLAILKEVEGQGTME